MNKIELELIKIPLSRLLKLELPRFAERMIGIVERHGPETLKIKEIHDLLVAQQPQIDKLIDRFGPNPLNRELRKLRSMRSLYISSIRFRLKVVIREDKSGVNAEVLNVNDELTHFFQNLELSKNDEMFSQKITQFLAKVNNNATLQTALDSLKFMEHIDDLTSVHNAIQELLVERALLKAERPREKTNDLVKLVLKATNNLMKQIDIAPLKHPELDYAPLYFELNDVLIEYRNLINKRLLFNKRKAEEINKANGGTTNMTTTTLQKREPVQGTTKLNVEEVQLKKTKTEQDKKDEAAATSSKAKQLPPVNDDDEA